MALVNQGAKVSDMGSKLIEIACNNNNQQLVEYLVAKGAVLNKSLPGNIHCDGIVSACKNNNSTMAKYLLDHGAKLGR
ncbi:hypothetical protein AX774_g2399 [Zancudomyces culisetae]|uniref:Uncharacterized protein n=1 Tax=Zancudomyces culisetae TaxID=1213189 RepID=A0A1R1PSV2_ZANCU|nr:hypothetical protein AX774_g2399 [Zancudomyces culisetae]|eukprot:OMH84076.1 hypothetical protein AX774_g2399 [Zancudomyces culisetae]